MLKRLVLLLAICFATTVHADTPDKVVNEVMQHYLQQNEVPGAAVLVFVDGKPYSYYFGVADLASKKPVTQDTIFELGSVTKVMTSILLAQEVDYAKIKLNEPINKYIPSLPAAFSTISVRSLATHTSGLPFTLPPEITSRAAWEEYAKTWHAETKPDETYLYSNLGIGLLGQAIEAVTHQSYNMLYRNKILKPLGMQPIALEVPKKLKPFYAQGYDVEGNAVPAESDGLFPAASAMKASASDMSKFLSAAIGLPATPESIFYPMRMTQSAYLAVGDNAQGLGWSIHEMSSDNIKTLRAGADSLGLQPHRVATVFKEPVVFNGGDLIDKTGTTDGFRAYIAVIPTRKTGIVILSNRNVPGNGVVIAAREILFKLNGVR